MDLALFRMGSICRLYMGCLLGSSISFCVIRIILSKMRRRQLKQYLMVKIVARLATERETR
ncbi:hypothetical protein [Bacillus sp. JCM 19034]|uniref:hypothetical protein n=1 Tax=Bacillus sp. JCM 19034 TaxID=1481928 RepID=UPI000783224E|nr:hypothetical protein [Bacillus sp. JCM 19034]